MQANKVVKDIQVLPIQEKEELINTLLRPVVEPPKKSLEDMTVMEHLMEIRKIVEKMQSDALKRQAKLENGTYFNSKQVSVMEINEKTTITKERSIIITTTK